VRGKGKRKRETRIPTTCFPAFRAIREGKRIIKKERKRGRGRIDDACSFLRSLSPAWRPSESGVKADGERKRKEGEVIPKEEEEGGDEGLSDALQC